MKAKILRIATASFSLKGLLKGQMKFMHQNGFDVIMGGAAGSEIELLIKNEKCPHVVFPFTRKITPLKDLKALFLLYRFLRKEKPQIVHSHTPKAGTVGMLAAKLAGVPVRLHTIAGLPLMESRGIKRFLLNTVEKITYSCATKIYPNSFGLQQIILENRFCSPDKLKVMGNGSSNGINTRFFHPEAISEAGKKRLRQKHAIQPEDFVFVFVGRLVKDKGINELVNAFKQIQNKSSKIKLLLVGPFEQELDPLHESTLHEIQNNPGIIGTGYQEDVRPYFALSRCLVFPSYREGFPNVPMQAGAMGLPSIVTDINGCNEIITHEFNGLIIPPKDTLAIESAMLRIMEDKVLYQKLKSNARESIVSRFDQLTLWKLIKAEYDEQLRLAGIES
jgi:glycosyltransferase involved in cell wall biosynthesis